MNLIQKSAHKIKNLCREIAQVFRKENKTNQLVNQPYCRKNTVA